jgi:hypothetical protein
MQSKERERNTKHSIPEVTLAHPKVNQPQQKGLGKYEYLKGKCDLLQVVLHPKSHTHQV